MRHFVVPGGNVGRLLKQAGFLGLGSPRELDDLIERKLISGSVVADLHHEQGDEWARLLAKAALRGVPVYHCRLIEEAITGEVRIGHLRENELGSLIPNIPYRLAKRVIDVASVIALAPFLLPALGLIALLIKLDGRGPILFYQKRLGHRGEYFEMVKFRTMRERSVEDSNDARRLDAVTRDGDDRITRVGRFLRKTRLDELPQAWNILKGEMSWIGPRPEASELANWYEDQIPFYAYRHIVRPGITGWAQVNQGHVADVDEVRAKLRFDFYYIKNLSLWLDLLIALKTIRVVLGGIGAK
jgi:lipopolysaccharide/colanic/teichoic acid biosynthesis glycosyltransferase